MIINESSISTKEDRQIIRSIVNEVLAKNGVNNSIGTYDSFIRRMVDNWAGTGHDRKFLFHVIEKSFHKFKSKKESKINIYESKFINEAKDDKVFTVRFDLAEVVLKSEKMIAPHIIIPYQVDGREVMKNAEIRITLWGGTNFRWEAGYKHVVTKLEEFGVSDEYSSAREIPKSEFLEAATGTAWSFTGKSDKVIRKFLTVQIPKTWKGYTVEFEGNLSTKVTSLLANKIADYFKMK